MNLVTYYDNYDFLGVSDYSSGGYTYAGASYASNPASASVKLKGLATGSLVKVLPNNDIAVADNLLLTVSYFDDFGRPLRVISDNLDGIGSIMVHFRILGLGDLGKK